MIRRLGYAQFASTRWLWWCLAPSFLFGATVIGLFEGYPEGFSLIGNLILPVVLGAVVLGVFAIGLLFVGGPDYWRSEKLPTDTPIYVDAAPGWIGIGWTDSYSAISRAQIERVRHHRSVLAITGCGNTIYVPGELMPPEAASALLSESERRNDTGLDGAPAPTAAPPPPFVTTPGDPGNDKVIRTDMTADSALAGRLGRAVRFTSALRMTILLTVPLPVAGVVALFLDSERRLVDSMFLPLIGIGTAIFGIIGYYVFVGAPAHMRKLVPEGAPTSAQFGPESICLRFGGCVKVVGLARITKVEQVDSALVLSTRGPREGLLIPAELVPPHVAEKLLARFG